MSAVVRVGDITPAIAIVALVTVALVSLIMPRLRVVVSIPTAIVAPVSLVLCVAITVSVVFARMLAVVPSLLVLARMLSVVLAFVPYVVSVGLGVVAMPPAMIRLVVTLVLGMMRSHFMHHSGLWLVAEQCQLGHCCKVVGENPAHFVLEARFKLGFRLGCTCPRDESNRDPEGDRSTAASRYGLVLGGRLISCRRYFEFAGHVVSFIPLVCFAGSQTLTTTHFGAFKGICDLSPAGDSCSPKPKMNDVETDWESDGEPHHG